LQFYHLLASQLGEVRQSYYYDLNSQDEDKFNSAISTISHLSKVLHIDIINEILERLEHSDSLSREIIVQELYDTLNRLSIDNESIIAQVAKDNDNDIEVTTEVVEESITKEEPVTQEEPSREAPITVTEDTKEQSSTSHKIDLSDVKPIHFDFSMEEAANDLSLPVDLIEEFVHDFIEQAHEETEKMLTAYDEGDLERVNKIGHLLKGTSSNLRIVPLADTLYKIQFCENLDELEPLIKDYWGHFLAFENYIKLRTN
jgi:HPt (histidine-containing phosphotransfer) domain-containing protein